MRHSKLIMDHLTKTERSALMSKIRSKHTKPEMAVRRLIWAAGFRYRLHGKKLPGCPDLVFARLKKVIFVHGCFWHGHICRLQKLPKTRTKFWKQKIDKNKGRDSASVRALLKEGWKSLTIWECEIKKPWVNQKIFKFLAE